MIATAFARPVRAGAFLLLVAVASAASAQPQPSAGSIALAKEIITVKGASSLYDPVVAAVIDRARRLFLQTNPMLSKDLNEVAAQLRTDLTPRISELVDSAAKLYASRFTEQELKDVLAFYKSPLGKKVITQEPEILDQSMSNTDAWAEKFSDEVIRKFRVEMKRRGHDV